MSCNKRIGAEEKKVNIFVKTEGGELMKDRIIFFLEDAAILIIDSIIGNFIGLGIAMWLGIL